MYFQAALAESENIPDAWWSFSFSLDCSCCSLQPVCEAHSWTWTHKEAHRLQSVSFFRYFFMTDATSPPSLPSASSLSPCGLSNLRLGLPS